MSDKYPNRTDFCELLRRIVSKAYKKGADYCDVRLLRSSSKRVAVRLGEKESAQSATKDELGIRIFKAGRSALASTTKVEDWRACLDSLISTIALLPVDRWAVPPPAAELGAFSGELAIEDLTPSTLVSLEKQATEMEAAALATKGINNSEGAALSHGFEELFLAAGRAEPRSYRRSSWEAVVSVLAGKNNEMTRDYEWRCQTHKIPAVELTKMAKTAATAAIVRLGAKKPQSRSSLPVVFSPRAASSLLGQLEALTDGQNGVASTTLFKDKLGEKVAAAGVSLINDPTRPRGAESYPFDMEMVVARRLPLIEKGIFRHWLLDYRSAHRLGLPPSGNGLGGPSVAPHPKAANLHIAKGKVSPEALMDDIKEGFYATELLGLAFNRLSGDWSRGAAGFLIRNGQPAEAVAEVTIAADIRDILARATPADDLRFQYGRDSPTLRVEGMTLAGK